MSDNEDKNGGHTSEKKSITKSEHSRQREREGEQEEIIKREYKWISKTVLRVGKEKMEASKVNWVKSLGMECCQRVKVCVKIEFVFKKIEESESEGQCEGELLKIIGN